MLYCRKKKEKNFNDQLACGYKDYFLLNITGNSRKFMILRRIGPTQNLRDTIDEDRYLCLEKLSKDIILLGNSNISFLKVDCFRK